MDDLKFFDGKTILITGGTGSVGSNLVKYLKKHANPQVIRIFSRDEHKQFEMQQELKDDNEQLRFLVGDVRDCPRLVTAMENVDIVFHAAALKHVPSCEYNPFEAVKTNIIGTENVIEAALVNGVKKVVFISTDKAVNPVNTMGASKLLAERMILNSNRYKGGKETQFSVIRFGNVLSSRGSVVPIFENQMKKGNELTLTDERMTRFIMSLGDAVKLVLKAAVRSVGGELFILKMPVLRISDMLQVMINHNAKKFSKMPEDYKINVIGMRPGEKLYEELMTDYEAYRAYETEEMFILPTRTSNVEAIKKNHEGIKKTDLECYSSKTMQPLSVSEIEEIFKKEKII